MGCMKPKKTTKAFAAMLRQRKAAVSATRSRRRRQVGRAPSAGSLTLWRHCSPRCPKSPRGAAKSCRHRKPTAKACNHERAKSGQQVKLEHADGLEHGLPARCRPPRLQRGAAPHAYMAAVGACQCAAQVPRPPWLLDPRRSDRAGRGAGACIGRPSAGTSRRSSQKRTLAGRAHCAVAGWRTVGENFSIASSWE